MASGPCVIGCSPVYSGRGDRLRNPCKGCAGGDIRRPSRKRLDQQRKITVSVPETLRDRVTGSCSLSRNELEGPK
jgi:hypothetical protein